MNAIDFEYDGQLASSWNLRFCQVDGDNGIEVSASGCTINFNQKSCKKGTLWFTTDTTYDEVLETTFQICKYEKGTGVVPLDIDEQRSITRWLNRKEPHKLRLISVDNTYDYVMFEGSFNIQKIETRFGTIGFELNFISNKPFATGEMIRRKISTEANKTYQIENLSDETGYIYPTRLIIECLSAGDLELKNHFENRISIIKNCKQGEDLSFDQFLNYSSSLSEHKLFNDFNYIFFRLSSDFSVRTNVISTSLNCNITIEYLPIIKGVGL